MRLIVCCLIIASFAWPQLSSSQVTGSESATATRIGEIMEARYAAGDFDETVLVTHQGMVI